MDNKILEYRKRHPRCRYCKYNEIVDLSRLPIDSIDVYEKCALKDKYLYDACSNIKRNYKNYKGIFCKWFEVKIK